MLDSRRQNKPNRLFTFVFCVVELKYNISKFQSGECDCPQLVFNAVKLKRPLRSEIYFELPCFHSYVFLTSILQCVECVSKATCPSFLRHEMFKDFCKINRHGIFMVYIIETYIFKFCEPSLNASGSIDFIGLSDNILDEEGKREIRNEY